MIVRKTYKDEDVQDTIKEAVVGRLNNIADPVLERLVVDYWARQNKGRIVGYSKNSYEVFIPEQEGE